MSWPDLSPRQLLVFGFLFLVALYTLFQARFLILGPEIRVATPLNGASPDSPVITVAGTARNIAYISLNGRQIYTDQKGAWSEKLIAPPGPSIMSLEARDRFGRHTEKQVEIVIN